MTVDQVTWRRTSKLGLTAHDREKAFQGYTLYTPMFGDGTVYLLDMDGNEVHRWRMPLPPGLYAYLLPNGNLFYGGKTPVQPDLNFPAWGVFKGGAMMEVDWEGNVIWRHDDPAHHHDARRTDAGALYLTVEPVPADVQARVRGGIPNTEHDGRLYADRIVEVDGRGRTVWEWLAWEHLDPETDAITPTDLRHEWSHGNTVVPLPGGDVIASFRNISVVGRISRKTGDFVWKLGYGLLAQQHDPSLLPNGNVLVFNNGARRPSPLIFSSVIEVAPGTGQVVWEYRDRTAMLSFFSSYISGAQRLPNGNTLICEGLTGRIFEVTQAGEVVWEYVNPQFFEAQVFGTTNAVFRAFRYGPERFPRLG